MNKLVVRGFLQWLDTATEQEIEARRGEFLAALEHFQGEDARADSASGFASSRRSWWRGRICGGHGRESCPVLEPCQELSGLRHPVGGEQGGGDLPFEGVARPIERLQAWLRFAIAICHGRLPLMSASKSTKAVD